MDLQTVFGALPVARFVDEHLHRQPVALAGSAEGVRPLGTWEAVAAMLGAPEADVLVVRRGEHYAGEAPRDGPAAQALCVAGYTLRVRHAERHHAGIAELAAAFEQVFRGCVDVQAFATPAGQPGFSWHYDAEEVFIIQTSGEKEYSLRKNTVNPWPLEETLPTDMQYEREIMPMMRVSLRAGDLLYIPCGWWHKAEAAGGTETAISLAVGVMSPTAIDLYDFLRPKLMASLVGRQRLPVRLDDKSAWQEAVESVAAEFGRVIKDESVKTEFFGRRIRES